MSEDKKPNHFYLVRHGETINNREHRFSGWVDSPLTPEGLEPAQRVINKIKHLEISDIFSSDIGRAFITAYVVSRGIGFYSEIKRLPGLREVNYGDAGNMPVKEAFSKYPGIDRDIAFVPPNGESLFQMQSRVFATVSYIDSLYEGQNILLVSHSGVMSALHSMHLGSNFGEHNAVYEYPHDSVWKFVFKDGSIQSFEEFGVTVNTP